MFLLDTDIYSLLVKDHERVTARVAATERAGERVTISAITRAEVLLGRLEYLLKAEDKRHGLRAFELLTRSEADFEKIEIIPITEAAADHFERLRKTRRRKKGTHADLLIACIALAHDATLVTRNVKDFASVPTLKVENWAD
jgi:tRNA(fMet)-specific endonuclease VapC